MFEKTPEPFFLDEVFGHFTKLAQTKKIAKELGVGHIVPYLHRTEEETTPMDVVTAEKVNSLLQQTEFALRAAVPFLFDPDTVSVICGREDAGLEPDLILPFKTTWIDNCTGENSENFRVGCLLQDKDDGKIQIRLFVTQLLEGQKQAEEKSHLKTPKYKKFHSLPRIVSPILMVRMSYDRLEDRLSFSDTLTPVMKDSAGLYTVYDYDASRDQFAPPLDVTNIAYERTCRMSLLLAQAVTHKNPAISFNALRKPDTSGDSLRVSLGKIPKRKPTLVTVNLSRVRSVSEPDENSVLAHYQKARHWVEAYKYERKDGRVIKVKEHERWKDSSPFPAIPKKRFVQGISGPE